MLSVLQEAHRSIPSSSASTIMHGMRAYSSADLYNWLLKQRRTSSPPKQ